MPRQHNIGKTQGRAFRGFFCIPGDIDQFDPSLPFHTEQITEKHIFRYELQFVHDHTDPVDLFQGDRQFFFQVFVHQGLFCGCRIERLQWDSLLCSALKIVFGIGVRICHSIKYRTELLTDAPQTDACLVVCQDHVSDHVVQPQCKRISGDLIIIFQKQCGQCWQRHRILHGNDIQRCRGILQDPIDHGVISQQLRCTMDKVKEFFFSQSIEGLVIPFKRIRNSDLFLRSCAHPADPAKQFRVTRQKDRRHILPA